MDVLGPSAMIASYPVGHHSVGNRDTPTRSLPQCLGAVMIRKASEKSSDAQQGHKRKDGNCNYLSGTPHLSVKALLQRFESVLVTWNIRSSVFPAIMNSKLACCAPAPVFFLSRRFCSRFRSSGMVLHPKTPRFFILASSMAHDQNGSTLTM
ncbi:hypothetical protein BDZ89DRAFT_486514 [Hymenopellis radicata]|nr:hypothetical protein BDZ89DRAFT_486514 [Hymenopellis radicata]